MIGIIDYSMGNINSIYNALNYLGYKGKIIKDAEEIINCSHLIIPGVGAYAGLT